MGCYLQYGIYYWEGPAKDGEHIAEVPKRPSDQHVWDGTAWQDNSQGRWVHDPVSMRFVLRPAGELSAIDLKMQAEVEAKALLSADTIKNLLSRLALVESKLGLSK